MEPNELSEIKTFERYLRRPGRRRLAAVVRLFHSYVWAAALRLTGNEEEAADLSQDLFLGLLLHPPRPATVRSPRGYLGYRVLTLATRADRSRERRRKREARAVKEAARETLSDPRHSPEDLEALRVALTELPARVRQVLQLRYYAGLKNRQIAEALDVSERTIEEDLREGREKLRGRLSRTGLGVLAALEAERPEARATPPPGLVVELLQITLSGTALAGVDAPAAATRAGAKWITQKSILPVLTGLLLAAAGLGLWAFRSGSEAGGIIRAPALVNDDRRPMAAPPITAEGGPESVVVLVPAAAADPSANSILVSGWTLDEEGEPVPGARVSAHTSVTSLHSQNSLNPPRLRGEDHSGQDGAFQLRFDSPGGYGLTLLAEKEGYAKGWTRANVLFSSRQPAGPLSGHVIVLSSRPVAVTGRVLGIEGGPIAGATVWAVVKTGALGAPITFDALASGSGQATTGSNGEFSIESIPDTAPFDLFVEHPRCLPRRLRQLVAGGGAVEVRLERGETVSGEVVDSSGTPVAGATVVFTEEMPQRFPTELPVTCSQKTDVSGRFRIEGVAPGTNLRTVLVPDRFLPAPDERVEIEGPLAELTIVLQAESWIAGTAREKQAGTPAAGATVVVKAGRTVRRLQTAADGSFACAVPPGPVEALPAAGSGPYLPDEEGRFQGKAEAGATLSGAIVWFRSRGEGEREDGASLRSIRGRVLDREGKPLLALVAMLQPHTLGFSATCREAVAGPEGRFELLPSRGGRNTIAACAPRRRLRGEALVEDDGTEVMIVLEPYPPFSVEGQVTTPNGAPIRRAGVVVTRSVEDRQMAVRVLQANEEGRFRLDDLLPDTQYRLNAIVEGVHGPTISIVPKPGEALSANVVFPSRQVDLQGVVRDSQGGPVAGLRIFYDFRDDELPRYGVSFSDREGRFRIEGLFAGTYQFLVDSPGFAVWGKEVDTTLPVEIVLTRTRNVLFEVLDAHDVPRSSTSVRLGEPDSQVFQQVYATDGRFTMEVPATQRHLAVYDGRGRPALEVDLEWPPQGDLDLGTIVLED